MSMDKVTLEIFANYTRAASESMAYTLYRTAYSTFVKETEDFTIGIATRQGQTAAVSTDLGATWLIGLDYGQAIALIDDYQEGDICITNDPYSGYACTHTPDLHIWKPVFWDGEIVCFSVGHIHNTDVGGAVPASVSRTLVEVHQEGIRIPPAKLYRSGELNDELLNIMLTNVRSPDQNWGDLKAMVGAVNTGERRIHDMIRKFGVEAFKQGLAGLLDYAEFQARDVLSKLNDGDFHFEDYIDEDSDGGYPIRLALKLSIRGDEAVLDFTGSDPQLASSNNVPTGGHARHTLILVGVYYCLYTLKPNLLLNTGLTRPFTCILPDGSVVNPQFPAAVGMRSLTCNRLRSVVFGAFSLAAPDRMPAAPAGTTSIMNVMTTDNETGERIIAAVNPIMGGGGALPFNDGSNGSGGDTTYLKNSPIEITESEVPIQILRYGLETDSGGAGRFRGGLAQTMEFKVFSPGTRITARNRDRSRFQAWGVLGGKAGAPSKFFLNPGGVDEKDLGNRDILAAGPGDVIRITSSGAGGYGDPLDRPYREVLADWRFGYISPAHAEEAYGVVIRDGVVDEAQSDALRERLTAARPAAPSSDHFHFGENRDRFNAVWTTASYDALTDILASIPVHWRFFIKHKIFAAIESLSPSEAGAHAVREAWKRIRSEFPQLADTEEQVRPQAAE